LLAVMLAELVILGLALREADAETVADAVCECGGRRGEAVG